MTRATRRSYDLVAADYAARLAGELRGKPLDRALLDALAELVGDGLILDIGCGPGHVASYLAGGGARLIGLDLSPVMCVVGAGSRSLPFCAADMTALPIRSAGAAGIVSMYAVIHLNAAARAAAYAEFARVLRPGGHALIAFHTRDEDVAPGGSTTLDEWWGHQVALTFRFLDPDGEILALAAAGFELIARLDRRPDPAVEHPSERSYLLVRRAAGGGLTRPAG